MKAIESFIIEAANEFGGGSEITETQVKSIVKKIKMNNRLVDNVVLFLLQFWNLQNIHVTFNFSLTVINGMKYWDCFWVIDKQPVLF